MIKKTKRNGSVFNRTQIHTNAHVTIRNNINREFKKNSIKLKDLYRSRM